MTRKESGWVSESLRLADEYAGAEYLSEAGAAYVRLRDFIDAKDASITSLQSAADGLEEALEVSRIAIDDWLNTYAAELCDETRVHEARERIKEASGTLAYIAAVQTANRAALAAWRNIAEFKEK